MVVQNAEVNVHNKYQDSICNETVVSEIPYLVGNKNLTIVVLRYHMSKTKLSLYQPYFF